MRSTSAPDILDFPYLLGVLAPDVFLRAGPSELEGPILNESMLEFDCTILLWTRSALKEVS